jgi:hypothetical protein
MSEQAEKFLAQWQFEHIADRDIVARSDREDQAQRLALRCREDAAKAGISSQDLEVAAEGNLIGNMCFKRWMLPSSGRCTATNWLTKKKIELERSRSRYGPYRSL